MLTGISGNIKIQLKTSFLSLPTLFLSFLSCKRSSKGIEDKEKKHEIKDS